MPPSPPDFRPPHLQPPPPPMAAPVQPPGLPPPPALPPPVLQDPEQPWRPQAQVDEGPEPEITVEGGDVLRPPPPSPPPPKELPILEWAKRKNTRREFLCLAAVLRQWDPLQQEGSLEEAVVIEEDFDSAIAEVRRIYEDAIAKESQRPMGAGARSIRILAMRETLIGAIVAKATVSDADRYAQQQGEFSGDGPNSRNQAKVLAQSFFVDHCIWPKNPSPGFAHIMREAAFTFTIAFPADYMVLCGIDANLGKGRG